MPARADLDDDALDALLRHADPGSGPTVDEGALLAGFAPSGRRARRRRRWVAALGGGLAVLVAAGIGGPALADRIFASRIGVLPGVTGLGTEDAPDSDWIDLREPDSVELAPRLWDDTLPLPPGYDAEGVSRALVYLYRMNAPAHIQAVTIGSQFEAGLRCLWGAELSNAQPGSARADRAIETLEGSADWPDAQRASAGSSKAHLESEIAQLLRTGSVAGGGCAEIVEHVDWYVGR